MEQEYGKKEAEKQDTENQHDLAEGTPLVFLRQELPVDDYGRVRKACSSRMSIYLKGSALCGKMPSIFCL
jgi:hypothetical protein